MYPAVGAFEICFSCKTILGFAKYAFTAFDHFSSTICFALNLLKSLFSQAFLKWPTCIVYLHIYFSLKVHCIWSFSGQTKNSGSDKNYFREDGHSTQMVSPTNMIMHNIMLKN